MPTIDLRFRQTNSTRGLAVTLLLRWARHVISVSSLILVGLLAGCLCGCLSSVQKSMALSCGLQSSGQARNASVEEVASDSASEGSEGKWPFDYLSDRRYIESRLEIVVTPSFGKGYRLRVVEYVDGETILCLDRGGISEGAVEMPGCDNDPRMGPRMAETHGMKKEFYACDDTFQCICTIDGEAELGVYYDQVKQTDIPLYLLSPLILDGTRYEYRVHTLGACLEGGMSLSPGSEGNAEHPVAALAHELAAEIERCCKE